MQSSMLAVAAVPLLLWLVVLVHMPAASHGRRDNQPYQIDENLLMLQCQMMFCAGRESDRTHTCNYHYCHKKLAHNIRPGTCPAQTASNQSTTTSTTTTTTTTTVAFNAISRWPLNTLAARQHCRHLCGGDSACPAAQKCCAATSNGCGRSCQPAAGLAAVPLDLLPAIPANLTVVQQLLMLLPVQPRSADISFVLPSGAGDVRLMLEARNHAGFAFRVRKLGQWHEMRYNTLHTMYDQRAGRTVYTVTVDALRPGRWYQFRAAAMGVHGTRGYSAPSAEFQLKEKPRNPHPPRNFTVAVAPRLQPPNGTVYARLTWRPPRSDYPVEKYRLTWELPLPAMAAPPPDGLLASAASPMAVVPMSQREAIITEPVRHYEFFDLRPNVVYTVHLQALTSFGRRRMKSLPESLQLSTHLAAAVTMTGQLHAHRNRSHHADDATPQIYVRLLASPARRFAAANGGPTAATTSATAAGASLVARVYWSEHYAGTRVDLRQLGDDDSAADRIGGDVKTVSGRAQRSVDFGALHWQRRYAVWLQNTVTGEWQSKEFRTPVCAEYRVSHPRVQCWPQH